MKPVIVHFILRDEYDKFPAGYINFMKLRMTDYEHHFFVQNHSYGREIYGPLKLCDDNNVYYYEKQLHSILQRSSLKLLRKCSKIIVSGYQLLDLNTRVFLLLSGLISKTYIQFWNGSYGVNKGLKQKILHWRSSLGNIIMSLVVKRAAGTINLIEGDRDALIRAFPSKNKHFIAPMPSDPMEKYNLVSLSRNKPENIPHRIVVGHCSYDCGQIETFHMLEHLKNEDIEVICPLSYGSAAHRDKVIEAGRSMFGEKFKPITEFMTKEEYIDLLSSCKTGIFATHVQHGLGNIGLLLGLGKKVYLRTENPMWHYFVDEMKYVIYPVEELEKITLDQLAEFPQEHAQNNIRIAEEYASGNVAVEKWREVFAD